MDDLAVVGMACRFPGAGSVEEFAELLRSGRSGLSSVDDAPDGWVPVTGTIGDVFDSDPEAIGLGEAECRTMDPQHRVFLECAKDALDHAGHGAGAARGDVGVFAGAGISGYLTHTLADQFVATGGDDPARSLALHTGNVPEYLALRTAHSLDLRGPAVSVGATCATSLAAIHLAANSLLDHECDTALAGGVTLLVPRPKGYRAVPDGPFSPDGHTRAYSEGAAGTVFTEGVGVVVLRRLEDALADGDTVHAVLRGTAMTNDGADKVGFTAPSVAGQVSATAQALAHAGVEPREIGLVEGHGTATALGDRIELAGLCTVHRDGPPCALGSVKTVIGHTASAAGVAGFIKAVLAVRDDVVHPSLDADPVDEVRASRFELPTSAAPWPHGRPRIAQVNSFGIGGTNVVAVLEQPPAPAAATEPEPDGALLPVSARSAEAADEWADRILDHLAGAPAGTLRDTAHTLAVGRREDPHRVAVRVDATGAQQWRVDGTARDGARVVFAFPGAGGLKAGQCRDLVQDVSFAAHLEQIADAVLAVGGPDVRGVLLDPSAEALALDPKTALPALFASSLATARTLADRGVRADAVVGHSVGEYAAAVVAGVLDLRDAALLVVGRADAMSRTESGAMLAVALDEPEVRSVLATHRDLDLAAVNGPAACVVAGRRAAVDHLHSTLRARAVRCSVVGIDVAAHSRLVEPAQEGMRSLCSRITASAPRIDFHSTVLGRRAEHEEMLRRDYWVEQLRATVRFADAMRSAVSGVPSVVVACGPGSTVVTTARAVGGADVVRAVPTFDEDEPDALAVFEQAVAGAWCAGLPVDLRVPRGRRIPLPSYPYRRRRLVVEPQESVPHPGGAEGSDQADAEHRLQLPTWQELPPADVADVAVAVLGDGPAAEIVQRSGARVVHRPDDADVVVLAPHPGDGADQVAVRDSFLDLVRLTADLPEGVPVALVQVGATEVGGDLERTAAAVRGAMRVIGQETDGLVWRVVDLDGPYGLAGELSDLAQGRQSAWEISLVGRRRRVRSWRSWRPATSGSAAPERVLVLGGLGAVGRHLAERLPQAQVVLASRRAGDESTWDDDLGRAMAQLRERCPGVRTRTVDVGDAEQVRAAVAESVDGEPFDLVVLATVDLDLVPLPELTPDVVADQLRAKVDGALNLEAAVDALASDRRPAQVVLMSSAAGTIGGFGLSAYVVGSRYLDAVAHTRASDGWLSVDWDRFRTGSAQEAETVSELTMRHAVTLADGITDLLGLLANPSVPAQVAVSPAPLDPRSITLEQRTVRESNGVEDLRSDAERLVADIWTAVLGRPITSRDDDFFASGGHSLLATRVLAALQERTGVEIRLRELLTASTVQSLAQLVDRETGGDLPTVEGTVLDDVVAAPVPPEGEGPFGVNRVQNAYLLGRQSGQELGGVACQFFLEFAATDFDPQRYEQAWRRVIERHEMLRTVIDEVGQHVPAQLPDGPLVRTVDLGGRSAQDAEQQLATLRTDLAERVADPSRWPLVEPCVVALPDGTHHVLVAVDVLVCDSASWMLVDRELRAFYADPAADLPTPQVSFRECLAELERRDAHDSPVPRRSREYWTRRLETMPTAPAIRAVETGGPSRFVRFAARVPADRWTAHRDEAAGARVTPTAYLLAHFADTLEAWSGDDHFAVTLTVFDRPDLPGAQDVVGEFSTLSLLECDPCTGDVLDRAARIGERLVDDLDHRGYSGLEVLADLARRTGRQENVPVVFTGMLGLDAAGSDTEPHDHQWIGPVVHGVSQTPQVWLDHQVFEHRGELVLQWDVNLAAIDREAAQRHFSAYVESLGGDVETLDAMAGATDETTDRASTGRQEQPQESAAVDPQLVRAVWAELLGPDAAQAPDDVTFLELGGDSLLAVRMAAQLRDRTGLVLPLGKVRADLTVADVVAALAPDGDATATTADEAPQDGPFALTSLQQAYYVGQQELFDLSVPSAHVVTTVPVRGVDADAVVPAVQHAVDLLVARHPMLRTRVAADGTQEIGPVEDAVPQVERIDLRDLSEHDADARVREVVDAHIATGPRAEGGPVMEIGVVLLPGGTGLLLTSFSLLAVDGWSMAVIERELLGTLAAPDETPEPLEIGADHLIRRGEQHRDADLAWWLQRWDGDLPERPHLPHAGRPATIGRLAHREARVEPSTHLRLQRAARRHEVTVSALALAAWGLVLNDLCGQDRMLLTSLVAHRPPVHHDVPNVVGPLSTTMLVDIDLRDADTFLELTRTVARSVTEGSDHLAVSAVDVARELGRSSGHHDNIAPIVFQSTTGMERSVGVADRAAAGPLGHVDTAAFDQIVVTPQVDLEMRVFDIGDELVLSLGAADRLYDDELLDRAITRMRTLLQELLDDDRWTAPLQLRVAHPQPVSQQPAEHAVRHEVDDQLLPVVLEVWSELFGHDVSPEDDFYALGGDSLLAVRMLSAVRRRTGVEVAARDFLADPRPVTVASRPVEEAPEETDAVPQEALVALRSGTGRPFFLVHPSGGDVFSYVTTVRLLDTDRPVLSITDPGLLGHQWPQDLHDVARRYATLMRQVQPEGPITLGGWSMGGTLALEVAAVLRERGVDVDGLVMVDSTNPERIVHLTGLDPSDDERTQRRRFALSVAGFLGLEVTPQEREDPDALCDRLVDSGAFTGRRAFDERFAVFDRHLRGLADLTSAELDASVPVLLLRATDRSPVNSAVGMGVDDGADDADLGWSRFVRGDLTVHDAPGHHYSVLRDDGAVAVAQRISCFIRNEGKSA